MLEKEKNTCSEAFYEICEIYIGILDAVEVKE